MRKMIHWNEHWSNINVDVEFDLIEVMNDKLTDEEVRRYTSERLNEYVNESSHDTYKELAYEYFKYEFDLKKLIEEIGIDEVKKVVKEMGGCDCGK